MKNLGKTIIAFLLGIVARAVVHRYQPRIVMVTGSVGKTSTKDAVAVTLATRYFVRKSEKSFNSEFGVPFTILGVGNPWGNPFAWLSVIRSALALLILPNHYPNMLVLETGADRPGDLARILRIATPHAVVVTRLPDVPVHVEAYTCPAAVREEEFSPAYTLSAGEPLILSADLPRALAMAKGTPARIVSFGSAPEATVRITDIDFYASDHAIVGMTARAAIGDEQGTLIVRGSVGRTQILPVAAALATAHAFNIPLNEAIEALEGYEPPPGRGRILAGVNASTIIDDSYNASPAANEEALATLKSFPHATRRIAILGDMLELGRYSVQEHERIGALACASADLVIAVGIRARTFALAREHCKKKGAELMTFDDSRTAAKELPHIVQTGDVILVKGSQSIRMERVVESLLADRADTVKLVRQEPEWKRRS